MALDAQYEPARTPFDFTRYNAPYEVDRIKILKELIPPGDGKKAIDIGCGPGFFSRELSEKGWRTTSIDSDGSNLQKAKVYAHEIHQGDAASVLSKLPEDHFDLALSLELIEHMPKAQGENLLAQIMRVLRTGGTFIVSTPNRLSPEGLGGYFWGEKIRRRGMWTAWEPTHVHIYTSSEILRLLRATGFVVDTTIGYYYEGRLPVIGHWRLPWVKSSMFPLNLLGFNIIVKCHKK
jgi:2-polyprenyl-3-methyl-5-hydroxy-6-metoxy-1,4-benzoquinol methylase